MPSTSPAQHRMMEAVAHDPAFAKRAGIPQSVGEDFAAADAGKKKFDDGGAVNVAPTDPQKGAGNYKKGHVKANGMLISIENPQGSTRSGTDADGSPWESEMASHYGYIRGTQGRDKDHLDVFLGPKVGDPNAPVHVIDQHKEDGSFDEHKVMLGFPDQQSAVQAYHDNYPDDWKGFGNVSSMPLATFKEWAYAPGRRVKPAAEHSVTSGAGYADGGSIPGYTDGGTYASDIQNFGNLSNLPADTWAAIQAYSPTSSGSGAPEYGGWTYGDYQISPDVSQGTGMDNVGNSTLNGFNVTHVGDQGAGSLYGRYDASGNYLGMGTVQSLDSGQLFLGGLLAAATMGTLGPLAGAASTAGAVGDAGGFIGEGAASGIPAWDSAIGSGVTGAGTAGATAADYLNGSDLMSDAFDANGGYGAGGFGGSTGSIAGAGDYVNGSDVMSDNFDANGGAGAGGFGGGTGAVVSGLSGAPTSSSLLHGLSNSDLLRLASTVVGGITSLVNGSQQSGGGGGGGTTTDTTPHDYGSPWYLPPGWRTDRPMYVPGSEAVPEGWLGAGGASA